MALRWRCGEPVPVRAGTGLGRGFWQVWAAGAVSSVGDGAFAAALPLLAATVSRDPRAVSLVAAATYLPWLVVSLPAGALVDRWARVPLMWRTQLAQLALVAALAGVAATTLLSVGVLAVVGFALGCCAVLFGNAAQSVLPELVAPESLARANGTQYAALTTGQLFLGPPLGSLLFAAGRALPFAADAVSFAASAGLLAGVPTTARAPRVREPMRAAIAQGLRWLAGHRLLRTLALLLAANMFCNQLGQATLVLFATGPLHLSAGGYGLLLAAGAAGSVLGGLLNPRIAARTGPRVAVPAALALSAAAYLAAGPAPNAVILGGLLAVNGFAITAWSVVTVTLRQQLVPAGLLGRVNSVYRMLGWGLAPLGALAGGWLAHTFGLRAPLPVAGGLRAIALLAAAPVLLTALPTRTSPYVAHPEGGSEDGDARQ